MLTVQCQQRLPQNGRRLISDEDVTKDMNVFGCSRIDQCRLAIHALDLTHDIIWIILRNGLKWKAYRPRLAQVMSSVNKVSYTSAACAFCLCIASECFERVIMSDEKQCMLSCHPNNQTNRHPNNHTNHCPHDAMDCKKANGQRMMRRVRIALTVDACAGQRILPRK